MSKNYRQNFSGLLMMKIKTIQHKCSEQGHVHGQETREGYILIQIAKRLEGLFDPVPLKLTGRQEIITQHHFICSSFRLAPRV